MHPRLPRGALAAVMIAATAAMAAGCGTAAARPAAGPEKTSLVVAAVPAESASGLYLAQEQGLFARAGLHVTIKTIVSPTAVLPALLHGRIDVVSGQWSTFIAAQAAGIGTFHALAPGFALGPRVEAIVVRPHSPITTVRRLKGATIAVNAIGGIDQMLANVVLRAYGISRSQVRYVAMPFPDMGAALAAHRVDAAYLTEPYLTTAEEKSGAVIIADPDAGPAAGLAIAGYTVTASWFRRYPRTAAAFARAVEQGNALATTNIALWQHVMAAALHLPPAVADVMASGTYPLDVDPVQLQRVADLMLAYGQLKKPFDAAELTK
jgi:NitT/TauT family transport system substrate-binding protein